jgi:hypothetical protein
MFFLSTRKLKKKRKMPKNCCNLKVQKYSIKQEVKKQNKEASVKTG